MAEARGYNKGAPLSTPHFPRRASPRPVPSRCISRHEASPRLVSVPLPRTRSLARPFARSRFAGWRRVPSSDSRRSLGIGKGRPRWRAQARGSNGKKSAGLTTGDGRRIDRANIGDRESAGVYGYITVRDAAHDDDGGYRNERVNDVPPNPGGFSIIMPLDHYDENERSSSLSAHRDHATSADSIITVELIRELEGKGGKLFSISLNYISDDWNLFALAPGKSFNGETRLSSGLTLTSLVCILRERHKVARVHRSQKNPHPFIRSTKRATKVRVDVARTYPMFPEVVARWRGGYRDDTGEKRGEI